MKRRLVNIASIALMLLVVASVAFTFAGSPRNTTFSRISSGLKPGDPIADTKTDTGGTAPGLHRGTTSGEGASLSGVAAAPTSTTGSAGFESYDSSKAPSMSGESFADVATDAPTGASGGTYSNRQYQSSLTAGQVDDNAKYQEYLDYLTTYYGSMNHIDVSQRLFVRVLDGAQMPIAGARVQLFDGIHQVYDGQTVSDGRILFFPKTANVEQASSLKAVISRGQSTAEATVKLGGPEQVVSLQGIADNTGDVGIDLVFLLDATGSMGDEINRIKETVGSIAQRIEQLPGSSGARYGLVAYRDRGDEYVTRQWDFTSDVQQFSANLANVEANGGGDYPEAVSEGLEEAVNLQGWADNATGRRLRMIVLVGDAPPHVDYNSSYPVILDEAVAKGIKIFPVGASNLDDDGEYAFRQFAQVTQGQFVFLTYANGVAGAPGTLTDKHVDDFTVQNLDSLIVNLVAGEVDTLMGRPVDVGQVQTVPVTASVAAVVPSSFFDSVGKFLGGENGIYVAALGSILIVVLYSTRREKVRVAAARSEDQSPEIYAPESGSKAELRSGPITAPLPALPLEYFRRAETADERDLVAAHVQPTSAEVQVNLDVQSAAAGQRTLPLS